MVEDRGLEATAWLGKWEIRMKRGGHWRDIIVIIDNELHQQHSTKARWLIIIGGGNDLSVNQFDFETLQQHIRLFTSILEKASQLAENIVIWIPGTRKDVHHDWWDTATTILTSKAKKNGCITVHVAGRTRQDQAKFETQCLRGDGIHITNEHFRKCLQESLEVLNDTTKIRSRGLTSDEAFGRTCKICGSEDRKFHKCIRQHGCTICQTSSHLTSICWKQLHMCKTCAMRGHKSEECPTHNK